MSVVSRDSIITSPQEEMGGPDRFSKKDKNIHLNYKLFSLRGQLSDLMFDIAIDREILIPDKT